jgi:hypothetical protein
MMGHWSSSLCLEDGMPRKNPALRYPVTHQRDHARPRTVPAPTTEQFDAQVTLLVYPVALGLWDRVRGQRYRERVLTLPVLVGILLSLVWRQMPSISELKRVLAHEPLLWVAPTTVSQQAIAERLETMPAQLFATLWAEVTPQLQQRARQRPLAHAPVLAALDPVYEQVWVVDSSRLEAVFKKSQAARTQTGKQLGGTLTTVLDVGSHLPVHAWVDPSPTVNDRAILPELRERTPPGTLLVLDRGYNSFAQFDAITEQGSTVVGRWTASWRAEVVQTLSSPQGLLDQIVRVGTYRSSPCRHPLRRIGRYDNGQWHWWVTTELDADRLPAAQVIALYAQRWRVEEVFLQVKRLLNLSYLWGSTANAIAVQVWTTLLVYGVLVDLCAELGVALGVPTERISVEMTYRSLYHYARACQQGETRGLVAWLSAPDQADLALVKRQRKRPKPDHVPKTDRANL